jgi:hypothetical protein
VAGHSHMDLAVELQKIYDSEINIRIGWLWDGGIDVYLGDDTNGYVAHENVQVKQQSPQWFPVGVYYCSPAAVCSAVDLATKACLKMSPMSS